MSLSLKCTICKRIMSVFDSNLKPLFDQDNKISVCQGCADEKSLKNCDEVPDETLPFYRNENLKPNCDCPNSRKSGGFVLNRLTLEIQCINCRVKCNECEISIKINVDCQTCKEIIQSRNLFDLSKESPRALLLQKREQLLEERSIPFVQRKSLASAPIDVLEDLYKKIIEADAYTIRPSQEATYKCLRHFKATDKLNDEKFEFVCSSCNSNESSTFSINDIERLKIFNTKICEIIYYMHSCYFTESILVFYVSDNWCYQKFRNMLYDFKEIYSQMKIDHSRNSVNFKPDSICLLCSEQFNFYNPPVNLHEGAVHAICKKCINSKDINHCPIDKFPLNSKKIISPDFLLQKIDSCCIENCSKRFNTHEQVFPFLTQCMHNICSGCQKNITGKCSKCYKIIGTNYCKENIELIKIIKFQEIYCGTHGLIVDRFIKKNEKISMNCKNCKFPGTDISIQELNKYFNSEITKIPKNDPISVLINENADFIPLNIKKKFIENHQNNSNPNQIKVIRFNKFLPNVQGSDFYWYESGVNHTFQIESNVSCNIIGIIIGKCLEASNNDVLCEFEFQNNKFIWNIHQNYPINENYMILYLSRKIFFDGKNTFFHIRFGKGRYFQGIKDQNDYSAYFGREEYFYFYFTSNIKHRETLSPMNLGGPFFGLIIEDVYVPHEYLPIIN